jgi:hypothetical protein
VREIEACGESYTLLLFDRDKRRRTQVARERSAKPLCMGANPIVASIAAGMAELADAMDLKSIVPKGRAGSTPAPGTNKINSGLMAQLDSALP